MFSYCMTTFSYCPIRFPCFPIKTPHGDRRQAAASGRNIAPARGPPRQQPRDGGQKGKTMEDDQ